MSIFILHRDLNITDNSGLYNCIKTSDKVYILFIFSKAQFDDNEYFSYNSVLYMLNSLKELSHNITLTFLYGVTYEIIEDLMKNNNITEIWENIDFTPFSKQRSASYKNICHIYNIKYVPCETISLMKMGTIMTKKNTAYKKFTPFFNEAKTILSSAPFRLYKITTLMMDKCKKINSKYRVHLTDIYKMSLKIKLISARTPLLNGGYTEAKQLLNAVRHKDDYYKMRDILTYKTTYLSAPLHFGIISPREFYNMILKNNKSKDVLIQQLLWREFYLYVVNYIHTNYNKKSDTLKKYNNIKWNFNPVAYDRWRYGKTGIKFVDAGIQQMLTTGYMHNRMRMISAMFLIHFLGIHWKHGEKWFAQNLLDYSYCNNFGGWVWCAGTEVHSNQFYKIFSIDSQYSRFDPVGEYTTFWYKKHVNEDNPIIKDLKKRRLDRIKYLASI